MRFEMKLIFLIIFCFSWNFLIGQNYISKVENFKKEIYQPKKVITPFKIERLDDLNNQSIIRIVENIKKYNSTIDTLLSNYLNHDYGIDHLLQKKKSFKSFLYLKGEEFFDVYKELITLENQINDQLSFIIENDNTIARITIYYNDSWIFSEAFLIAKGFKGFSNIDHFRIKESKTGRVLRDYKHGEFINGVYANSIGIFENNLTYHITYPIIFKNKYLADIKYTIYK